MLYVRIRTKPITRFLRFIRIIFLYAHGGSFKISAYVKNFGSAQFQGGKLRINVTYALGSLPEFVEGKIGVIDPDPEKEVKVDFEGHDVFGVLANGHALFWASVFDSANNSIDLCNEKSQPLQKQNLGYHVHTFHSLTIGELYSLIALTVNSIAFITNVILTTIVNREKLSDIWNLIWNYQLPLSLLTIVAVTLWLVFVYVLYDRYGL